MEFQGEELTKKLLGLRDEAAEAAASEARRLRDGAPPTRQPATAAPTARAATHVQTAASAPFGASGGVRSSSGTDVDPGVVAAHNYSGRVVPCDFPDCDGRAVCCVRNNARRYRDVCASCRHWYCSQSTPVPVAGIAAWLAESPERVQAWCNLPTP